MQIYTISKNAEGIERFLNLVRQSGNIASLNPDTEKFEIFSRFQDTHYMNPTDVARIRQEEIGPAVEEVESLNSPDQLSGARRPASLSDILSARKLDIIPTEAVAKPYDDQNFDEDQNQDQTEPGDEEYEAELEAEDAMENIGRPIEEEMDEMEKDMDEFEMQMKEQDDPSLPETEDAYNNTSPALPALHEAARTISNAKRDRILKVVQETLGNDLTDVSDILLMLSETAELKKALSAILALLSIEVSMSAISRDYKVQPKVLRFAADRSESLENYRRGVAQVMIQIREILADKEKTAELEISLKTAESNLEAEKRNASIAASRHENDVKTLKSLLSPPALMSARFLVFWEKDGDTIYLSVEANAPNAAITDANKNQNPPPPFEATTKRCSAVMKQNQAYKFTSLESAQAQVARLTKFASNCPFFDGEKPKLMVARLGLDIVG